MMKACSTFRNKVKEIPIIHSYLSQKTPKLNTNYFGGFLNLF